MRIEGGRVLDDAGRTLILRGCNLGGSNKVPAVPDGATYRADGLRASGPVSFVGRPFPLEEADEHFGRLKSWGFNFLRFLVTWEAIEHAGPGIYDEAYLAYVRKILKKAEEYGFSVFIDPHQDVWSRWTGGDGAPAWTLEKIGIDLSRIYPTGAALTHQEHGDPFPRMAWPTNYNRYAAATMFTLFFAGDAYAPGTLIDGEGVQAWLQARYFAALRHACRRLKDCGAIVGWGSMNEPHEGFVGYRDLSRLENNSVALGAIPSGFQAMVAASGRPVEVPVYRTGILGARVVGRRLLNPGGLRLFKDGFDCPWKAAGVWTDEGGEPRLLRKDHFALFRGRPASFKDDFLKPFLVRFAREMREQKEPAMIFVEGVPGRGHPEWKEEDGKGVANAFHWYDGATLFTKRFVPWFSVRADTRKPVLGRAAVARSFRDQLASDVAFAREKMGGMPCLLGEFGLPFDMNGKYGYRTGDYRPHETALGMYYDAVDSLMLHSTIWNYTADNTVARGDGWNDEDLSIWSKETGPKAIDGWRRPYPTAVAGTPLAFTWDRRARRFELRFRPAEPDSQAAAEPTVVYAPAACFGGAPEVEILDEAGRAYPGASSDYDEAAGLLSVRTAGRETALVRLSGRS